MNIYQENGFNNRDEYLSHLAEDLDIDIETVMFVADLLGPSEDFDGLVTTLEDYAEGL